MEMNQSIDLTAEQRVTVQALLAQHLPNTEAWVYGSRVKWTSHPSSDLDMVVFATPEQKLAVADLREAFEESNLPFRVDLFVWDELSDLVREQIEREYVVLSKTKSTNCTRNWSKVNLGECIKINQSTYSPSERWSFVNYLDTGSITDNQIEEVQRLDLNNDKLPSRARRKVQPGEIVYSTVRPNKKHFGLLRDIPDNFLASTGFAVIRAIEGVANTGFIYWFLKQDRIINCLQTIAEHSTSAYPSIKPNDINNLEIDLPPLKEQKAIAHILGALDDKIELNRKMNQTLEAMAKVIFKDWFVDFGPVKAKMEGSSPYLPSEIWELFSDAFDDEAKPIGWKIKSLSEVARFLNGLPLQKFPASNPQDSLPVIKIAELRNGITDRSNRASRNIPQKYIVKDGDFLFSWSGSLVAKFWTEGDGALNQHLFKVTSNHYPSWFFSHWVYHHLREFQSIAAAKATTMGHIQRVHLTEAAVNCPPDRLMYRLGESIGPLVERSINNNIENRKLIEMRNFLLPKLISGEIRLRDVEDGFEINSIVD